jgi:hypothetical protein
MRLLFALVPLSVPAIALLCCNGGHGDEGGAQSAPHVDRSALGCPCTFANAEHPNDAGIIPGSCSPCPGPNEACEAFLDFGIPYPIDAQVPRTPVPGYCVDVHRLRSIVTCPAGQAFNDLGGYVLCTPIR